ncbi:MAG: SufD family Fe-S cluster assembly protein [Candidatus Peribacter sp.]
MQKATSSHTGQKMTLQGKAGTSRCIRLSSRRSELSITAARGSEHALFITCGASARRFVVKIAVEPRAILAVVFMWKGKKRANIAAHITVGAGGRFRLLNVTHGSCVHKVVSEVSGRGGESFIDWIIHGRGTMKCLLSARNIFTAKNGRGDVIVRGVAEGDTKIVCHGSVEIGPKASGTQAHLTEKILVLDPTARVDVMPSLDVKTHDVSASHSASISRIHPEDLFYFASRGILEKKARKLFIEGFLGSMLEDMPEDELRKIAKTAPNE